MEQKLKDMGLVPGDIIKVAQRAKVARATVIHALLGTKGVTTSTAKRVFSAVKTTIRLREKLFSTLKPMTA